MDKPLERQTEFLFYKSACDDKVKISISPSEDTVWATQKQMSDIFCVDDSGISRHLKSIFESNELDKDSVVANFATTGRDGKTYKVDYYNLDAIISE